MGLPAILADTADRFCVDILSGAVKLPPPGDDAFFARYGLIEGIPKAAADALGVSGTRVISNATLASARTDRGDFIVALGGDAGGTCRIIVYRTDRADLPFATLAQLLNPARGWKQLPPPASQPIVIGKLSVLKRRGGQPFLANLLSPLRMGTPIALSIVVAAIPPYVTVPPGF